MDAAIAGGRFYDHENLADPFAVMANGRPTAPVDSIGSLDIAFDPAPRHS